MGRSNSKTWVPRMLEMAKLVSTWSKDPNRRAGAVITTEDYRILSTGFNGYPAGFDDSSVEHKNIKSIHAEVNALLALRNPTKGMRMFVVGGHPCAPCAAAICQSDVSHLYCPPIEKGSSWQTSMEVARDLFREHPYLSYFICGLSVPA